MPHKRGGGRAADGAARAIEEHSGRRTTRHDLPRPPKALGGNKELRRHCHWLSLVNKVYEEGGDGRAMMMQAQREARSSDWTPTGPPRERGGDREDHDEHDDRDHRDERDHREHREHRDRAPPCEAPRYGGGDRGGARGGGEWPNRVYEAVQGDGSSTTSTDSDRRPPLRETRSRRQSIYPPPAGAHAREAGRGSRGVQGATRSPIAGGRKRRGGAQETQATPRKKMVRLAPRKRRTAPRKRWRPRGTAPRKRWRPRSPPTETLEERRVWPTATGRRIRPLAPIQQSDTVRQR